MFCPNCGKEIAADAQYCGSCGAKIEKTQDAASARPAGVNVVSQTTTNINYNTGPVAVESPKSRVALALLAFFLGQLGIHRFYAGKIGTGVVQLVLTVVGYATLTFYIGIALLVIVGIWVLIDFIMAVIGKFKDKDGLYITRT